MKQHLRKIYVGLAILLLNSVLAGLLIYLALFLWIPKKKSIYEQTPGIVRKYGLDALQKAYPGYDAKQLLMLLQETWLRAYEYSPYLQYRERPFRGRYVNVDEKGLRKCGDEVPWPPEPDALTVFFFGGSTTFGYGVADCETVPARLQSYLTQLSKKRVHVYNFGAGDYYSTQERILYERLLTHGYVPDIAIFMDGLNEFKRLDDSPVLTARFESFANQELGLADALVSTKAVQRSVWGRLHEFFGEARRGAEKRASPQHETRLNAEEDVFQQEPGASIGLPGTISPLNDINRMKVEKTFARYLANIRIIDDLSKGFGVSTFHVFQPVFKYNHHPSSNPFIDIKQLAALKNRKKDIYATAYELMSDLIKTNAPGPGFIWAADLNRDESRIMYVDRWHYAPLMCDRLAEFIAARVFRILDSNGSAIGRLKSDSSNTQHPARSGFTDKPTGKVLTFDNPSPVSKPSDGMQRCRSVYRPRYG